MHERWKYLWLLLIVIWFAWSCKKETLTLKTTKQSAGTAHNLESVFFLNADTGFAAGGLRYDAGTILQTTNGGQTWNRHNPGTGKTYFSIYMVNARTAVAVGFDGKISRTADFGTNWDFYQFGPWFPLYDVFFVNDSVGFAVGGGSREDRAAILSTNNRGNWWGHELYDNELMSIYFTDEQTGYVAGFGIVLKTTDGGQSWAPTTAEGDFFEAIVFPTVTTGYVVGNQGTILKTTDAGSSWEKLRNGNKLFSKRLHFHDVCFIDAYTGYVVGRDGVMMKTVNGGTDWITIESFTGESLNAIYMVDKKNGYVAGDNGTIYRFTDQN